MQRCMVEVPSNSIRLVRLNDGMDDDDDDDDNKKKKKMMMMMMMKKTNNQKCYVLLYIPIPIMSVLTLIVVMNI